MNAAIFITARNEASIIAATVARCRASSPTSPVHVVADRCTDDTAARARAEGAVVWERRGGELGKGASLRWFLSAAQEPLASLDALVILDADSEPHPGMIESLTRALADGAGAAQGFVAPVPDLRSPASVLAAFSEWLSQAVDDRVRARLGWPVPLRGTGMAFRVSVLRSMVTGLRTTTEDVELTLLLALSGSKIAFVPEAVVRDPKPVGTGQAVRQRARWLQGQRDVWRYYWRPILRLLVTRGPGAWSLISALLMKPRTLVMAAKALLILALGAIALPVVAVLRLLVALSLGLDILRYLIGVFLVPREWRGPVARALMLAPLYAALWLRATILSVVSRGVWHRARD